MQKMSRPNPYLKLITTLITNISASTPIHSLTAAITNCPLPKQQHTNLQLQHPATAQKKQIQGNIYQPSPQVIRLPVSHRQQDQQFPEAVTNKKHDKQQQPLTSLKLTSHLPQSGQNDSSEINLSKLPLLDHPPSIQPQSQFHPLDDISKQQSQSFRPPPRQSSEESSVNLQLTMKTKQTKNLTMTHGKVDSLMYSDATLMYSNATGFNAEASQNLPSNRPQRTQSHKSALRLIEDGQENEISTRMERAVSRQMGRVQTQNKSDQQQAGLKKISEPSDQGIFKTEISDYKLRIGKIRELKQSKKKKLENQLKKVNQEIQELVKRELQGQNGIKANHYQSRVKISDNTQAKVKAQRLVRELREEKRSRHEAQLGDLQVIDKNIHLYMEQIMKERYKNQERIKQRKKLQIIQRMKQHQMKKIQEQKKKDNNIKFVTKLRNSNSKHQVAQVSSNSRVAPTPIQQMRQVIQNKEKSPTKKSQEVSDSQLSPQLSRKKAYLKKVRNISFKKQRKDAYQQVLM